MILVFVLFAHKKNALTAADVTLVLLFFVAALCDFVDNQKKKNHAPMCWRLEVKPSQS